MTVSITSTTTLPPPSPAPSRSRSRDNLIHSTKLLSGRLLDTLRRMRSTFLTSPPPATALPSHITTMSPSHSRRSASFPSLAFASSSYGSYAMDIPLKATPSPPSTSSSTSTSSDSDFRAPSLSSSTSSASSTASSFTSVSHPDWPRSETLSNPSSPYADSTTCATNVGGQASCYISDEDLQDLASLPLWNDMRVPEHYLPAFRGGNAQLTAEAYATGEEQELPPASMDAKYKKSMRPICGKQRRRRSKEYRRKPQIMTPISESGE